MQYLLIIRWKMNKKGQEAMEKSLYYAIFGFVLTAVFLIFLYYVGSDGIEVTRVPKNLEEDLFYSRIINSNCFTYYDLDSGRTFANTLDWNKFNQYNLDSCYYADNEKKLGYNVKLKNIDTGQEKTAISTANFKKKTRSFEKKVMIYQNDKIYEGELTIDVDVP